MVVAFAWLQHREIGVIQAEDWFGHYRSADSGVDRRKKFRCLGHSVDLGCASDRQAEHVDVPGLAVGR